MEDITINAQQSVYAEQIPETVQTALEILNEKRPGMSWNLLRTSLNILGTVVHSFNVEKGFWDKPKEIQALESAFKDQTLTEEQRAAYNSVVAKYSQRDIPGLIALMHSELSEGLEADRKDLMDDKLPHRLGVDAELIDCMIRIFDCGGGYNIPLGDVFVEKLAYNLNRERMHGGKKY